MLPSGNAKLGDFSVFNNNLYFYSGSAWLLVDNSGSVFPVGGDLSGTTANAHAARYDEWIDAQRYIRGTEGILTWNGSPPLIII